MVRFDSAGRHGPVWAAVALAWTTSGTQLRDLPPHVELTIGTTTARAQVAHAR